MKDRPPPEVCPVCGEDVPRNAKACPECGSCHKCGWSEEGSVYDGTDITDHGYEDNEKFDYDGWLAREEGRARPPDGLHPAWKWVIVVVVIAFAIFMVTR